MKVAKLALLVSCALALSPFVETARAFGGADVFHYYYSDASMTTIIAWTEKTYYNTVLRHGIYEGGPGWDNYIAAHPLNSPAVYERFDQWGCDSPWTSYICIVWFGSGQSFSKPESAEITCPF